MSREVLDVDLEADRCMHPFFHPRRFWLLAFNDQGVSPTLPLFRSAPMIQHQHLLNDSLSYYT